MILSDDQMDRILIEAKSLKNRVVLDVYPSNQSYYWYEIGRALGALIQDLRFRVGQEIAGLNQLGDLLGAIAEPLGMSETLNGAIHQGAKDTAERLTRAGYMTTHDPEPAPVGTSVGLRLATPYDGLREWMTQAVRAPP